MSNEEIANMLREMDEKLTNILIQQNKETLPKPAAVENLVVQKSNLVVHRDHGVIYERRVEEKHNDFEYCLESIPKIFILNYPLYNLN